LTFTRGSMKHMTTSSVGKTREDKVYVIKSCLDCWNRTKD